MKRESRYSRILASLSHFLVFFLLVAFIITCCMLLFISVMSNTLNIELTSENIGTAAKLTFINVLFISFLFTVVDSVRRQLTVSRHVKRITDAAERLTQGDFSVRISPIRDTYGSNTFGEIIDCFNKMAEELEGTETLQTDFVANVSHEMKTPLSVMQNYGTLLQAPALSDEKRVEYAKAITDASHRLADMMTNILKLNRLENQQIFPQAAEYDLGEQLCECLLQFENVWESAEIEIDTDIAEGVTVRADAELMSLVWNNLFSNAFKFTDKGGTVSLTLTADEKYATVRVKDTGCGISSEVGAHIFDKFYQGDTSRATQGNGLGLALVKRVIDITGSDISVESELGRGTIFTVKMRRMTDGHV